MSKSPSSQELLNLFNKFSAPIIKPAITKKQKTVALGIAKTLWISLVSGNDTERDIYNTLNIALNNNHQNNIAVGSLYFYKMKTALSEEELKSLVDYYCIDENFMTLKNWLDDLQ